MTVHHVAGPPGTEVVLEPWKELASEFPFDVALVACAGITLRAVATSLKISVAGGTITAEGDLGFRGTLGREQGGAGRVRLGPPDLRPGHRATAGQLRTLIRRTERYCVVYQTLAHPPELTMTAALRTGSGSPLILAQHAV